MDKLVRKRKIKFRSLQLHYIINTIKTHNYSKCKTKKTTEWPKRPRKCEATRQSSSCFARL